MNRRIVTPALVIASVVAALAAAEPPTAIFSDAFEMGDSCDWSAAAPARCGFCPDAGTLALWHFGEAQGQDVADASGWGRALTLGPTAAVESDDPSWGEGRFGAGLAFDSSQLQFASGTGSNTFSTNQLTVELWLRPTGGSGNRGNAQVFTAGFINCSMITSTATNQVSASVGNGSTWSSLNVAADPVDLDDGGWHYLAMTYDGATLAVYVDGAPVGGTVVVTTLASPDDYKVGGRPENTFLDGWIDEVRLSDVARTPQEIAAAWSASLSCPAGG